MADITRLKQQNRGFRWIDVRTIEYVFLCRTDEGNVGLDVVEAAWLIAEVLPLILNDGEAVPHGLHTLLLGVKAISHMRRLSLRSAIARRFLEGR